MCVTPEISEGDLYHIAVGENDWGYEVVGVSWRVGGEATALVQQDRSVHVSDCDVIACAVLNSACHIDLEVSEL